MAYIVNKFEHVHVWSHEDVSFVGSQRDSYTDTTEYVTFPQATYEGGKT